MDNSLGGGFMAVFAVSTSVVVLAMQVHKRLLSDFMEKMEFEIGHKTVHANNEEPKKKVRFADEEVELSSNNRHAFKKHSTRHHVPSQNDDQSLESMPLNWQIMYKGILESRNIRG